MESTLLPSPKSPLQESRKVVLWLCAGHKGAVPQTEQKIALWMDQLRRMREMQYAYHKKFFHGLCLFLVLVIGCLLWDSSVSLALVPLLVITAGTQSCFYLHFVDFARIHARFVEGRLNQALGKSTLVGSEIEDLYFYPRRRPQDWRFCSLDPASLLQLLHLPLGCALARLGSSRLVAPSPHDGGLWHTIPDSNRALEWPQFCIPRLVFWKLEGCKVYVRIS